MANSQRFSIDDTHFNMDFTLGGAGQKRSTSDEFVLLKSEAYLAFYRTLLELAPKKIVEIGMFEGGSMAYYDKLYRPDKLAGFDIRNTPIGPLEEYRKTRPYITTHYGISQDDPAIPGMILADLGGPADLIVDDASHMYDLTRDTFINCFNLLRPGGLYVIEDWSWSHEPPYQGPDGFWNDKPSLTNLIFELVVETKVSRAFPKLTVYPNWVVLERAGAAPFEPMGDQFLRGREFPRI